MSGKILKVASNDLYGNVDDRSVTVYACFKHIKYMNNYVVFSINEDGSNKLCFGSVHLRENSIVIFSVKETVKQYIELFLEEYLMDKLESFELFDLKKIEKVELVSYNDMDYKKLGMLYDKAIPKVRVNTVEVVKEKKPIFIYLLLIVLVLLLGGVTLLYFKPELFVKKYRELECRNNLYDNDVKLSYDEIRNIKFDKNNKVDVINVIRSYTFLDSYSYFDFKGKELHNVYFNGDSGKYIDEELKLRVFSQEESVIDDYDEMLIYLKREGFSCTEKEYEK